MLDFIKALCAIIGVSGREDAIRAYIIGVLSRIPGLSCQTDPLGNLIVKKGASPGKMALFAHMDEVGLLVTHVTAEGLLGFGSIGMDPRILFGRRVLVGGSAIPGVIGGKAWHHLEAPERDAELKIEHMAIDIGARDKDEALAHVRPGDAAVLDLPFTQLCADRIAARALDNRVGCALLVRMLVESSASFTGVFTVQEESGMAGAAAAAATVNAPVALVLETTTAGDLPDVSDDKKVCRLGEGPVLSFADKGAIYSRELFDKALLLASNNNIPAQVKEGIFGGNDSREVQRAGRGARTVAVSVPCRYLHSASCVLDMADIRHTESLLRALLSISL